MKVKIGDKVHDSEIEPVMVILSPADKVNINAMPPQAVKYCAYPEELPTEYIKAWMAAADPLPVQRAAVAILPRFPGSDDGRVTLDGVTPADIAH